MTKIKRVTYPTEVKMKAVGIKLVGLPVKEIMEKLSIKNAIQIKTWMRWHKNGETHRYHQSLGK